MSRFDRYLLSQLIALFGFFSLVLVAVYWVNRAVGLFDQLIGDGQSALVFLEFSLLTLPNAIRLVLPVSAFAATVYAVNRLMADSELVVVQATGFSPFRLARAVLVFGLVVMGMMLVLAHVLVPASRQALAERSAEISQNVTARFLNDGRFMHPADGITLYIRHIAPTGELNDVFLSDERGQEARITYTARRALLVRGEVAPKLIMIEGSAQSVTRDDRRISVTRFQDFTFDLAGLMPGGDRSGRTLDELSTAELLFPTPALLDEIGETRAAFLAEGHGRFATPLLAVATPMVGFAALMLGAFSRFGLLRQIGLAVAILILVQLVNTSGSAAAMKSTAATGLVYAAPALGLGVATLLLWLAQRPRRIGRPFWRRTPTPAPGGAEGGA